VRLTPYPARPDRLPGRSGPRPDLQVAIGTLVGPDVSDDLPSLTPSDDWPRNRLHLSLTFAASLYYNFNKPPVANGIRIDIRCQMGYNFWQTAIEYRKRWGRVPRDTLLKVAWTPKGQAGWIASRPANLSGQKTLPGSASGKLSALRRPTPTGQISRVFRDESLRPANRGRAKTIRAPSCFHDYSRKGV